MLENYEIRARARAILQGNWNTCAIILLVYWVVNMGISVIPMLGSIASIFIAGPLTLSLAIIFLRLTRNEPYEVGMVFEGFKDFGRSFVGALLVGLYTFLWTLLLIIPGIIASISYSMTFFIIADNPRMSASDAITASKNLMMGHKTEYFLLQLSFLGWILLGICSLGIGFLWIGSYMQTANTVFYHEISGDESGVVRPAEEQITNQV